MGITTITTVLNVADHELGVAWCADLLGREPHPRPVEGSAERQVTDTSAVMVYADADKAGGGTLIVGVISTRRQPSCTTARSSCSRTRCRRTSSGSPSCRIRERRRSPVRRVPPAGRAGEK
jgi:hypothetical protein